MDPESDTQAQLKEYLEEHKIHDLFTNIVEELLKSRPEKPLQQIANYLASEHGVRAEDDSKTTSGPLEVIESYDDDEDESSDEEDDEVDELVNLPKKETKTAGRRTSVSAGVLNFSEAVNTKAAVFEKPDEDQKLIQDALKKSTLFSHCDPQAVETVIAAMEPCTFADGEVIIKENDPIAEHFFLLKSGTADALKGEQSVKSYTDGEGFGELALLYNKPRAATVKATSEVSAWRLDQTTFKKIVVVGVIQKRERTVKFLQKCSLFKELNNNELQLLADSLTTQEFKSGDTIITQGDVGQNFYVVESGDVECIKDGESVLSLTESDYFGEIALLYDKPRQASVVAKSPSVSVMVIDRKTFQRLMGPLGEILRRNPLYDANL